MSESSVLRCQEEGWKAGHVVWCQRPARFLVLHFPTVDCPRDHDKDVRDQARHIVLVPICSIHKGQYTRQGLVGALPLPPEMAPAVEQLARTHMRAFRFNQGTINCHDDEEPPCP